MQQAVTLLMKDVDPATIEAASQSDRGLAGMVGSRKARLWDVYVARWQAHARRHDNAYWTPSWITLRAAMMANENALAPPQSAVYIGFFAKVAIVIRARSERGLLFAEGRNPVRP